MDTIREQLVKKAYSPDDKFKKYAVLAASLLVAILLATLVLLVLGRGFVPIAILFAGLVMWGGYYLSGNFNIEYEYIVAGKEITIDKIIDKRKRKTLCSFELRQADAFYKSKKEASNASVVYACGEGDVYTIEFTDKLLGRCFLQFTPDEKTLQMITKYLPRAI